MDSRAIVAQPCWLWGRRASRVSFQGSAREAPAGLTGWEACGTIGLTAG